MWIKASIVAEVDTVAHVFYLDADRVHQWNANRHEDELRMMSGWVWSARDGSVERVAFKTSTAAYINAYQMLVVGAPQARVSRQRPRLRVSNDQRRRA